MTKLKSPISVIVFINNRIKGVTSTSDIFLSIPSGCNFFLFYGGIILLLSVQCLGTNFDI